MLQRGGAGYSPPPTPPEAGGAVSRAQEAQVWAGARVEQLSPAQGQGKELGQVGGCGGKDRPWVVAARGSSNRTQEVAGIDSELDRT